MNHGTIKISADSTCDLSPELRRQYGIDTTPLSVVMDGTPYRDGVDITPDDLFRMVEKTGRIGSTTAVNVGEYLEFFGRQLEGHEAVIHFTISSEMSSCWQSARVAAAELHDVYVVDSRNLSSGIGQLVVEAAELALQGMSAQDIVAAVEEKKQRLDVSFVLDTLEYMRIGGRCSAVVALGANLLHLKPSIQVKNGKMGVAKKYSGSLERALIKYVQDKLSQPETVEPSRVFITDSGVEPHLRQVVEQTVLECVPFAQVYHTRAGCTISNHCGPNCLGILFFRKEAQR